MALALAPSASRCDLDRLAPSTSTASCSAAASTSSSSLESDAKLNCDAERFETINHVLRQSDLYQVLGLSSHQADPISLRRAYLARSRSCHPDKFPEYPLSTLAFQKVSLAYEVLSTPASRRAYDANPSAARNFFAASPSHAENTLNAVLYAVFSDFMQGDFEMVRTFLRAVNEINPAMNLGEDNIESLVGSFRKLRDVLLTCQTSIRLIRIELMHLAEIQHSLGQLPYFAVRARLRLTLQLARVMLSLPVTINKALEEEAERNRARGLEPDQDDDEGTVARRKGFLIPSVTSLIRAVVFVLERGESVL